MILYLVDELCWVFQTHTYGYALCLDINLCRSKITIHITGTVSCGKDYRSLERYFFVVGIELNSLNTHYCCIAILGMIDDERCHLGLEMHLSTTSDDGLAHILNDTWQFVGTNMRMCIGKNACACSMLTEHIQDFVHATTFLTTCVELTIGIGSCSTLTKAVV